MPEPAPKFAMAEHLMAAAQPAPARIGEKPPEPPPAAPAPGTPPAAAAAAAPPAAPAAPVTDPDEEIISGKRNPKSEDFKRVKTAASEKAKEAEEAKKSVEALRLEVEALKKSPKADPAELEQARKDLAQAKELQNIVALEYAPEFQAKYTARRESVVGDLKGVLAPDKLEDVVSLLEMADSPRKLAALNEAISDMSAVEQNEVMAANRQFRTIRSEREAELKNATDRLTKIHADRTAQGQLVRTRTEEAFAATQKALLADNPLFKRIEGDEAWNADVDARTKQAHELFYDKYETVEEKVKAAHMVASVPLLLRQMKALSDRATTAEAQLVKLQGASPGLKGGGGSAPPPVAAGGFASKVIQSVGA